MLIDLSSIAYPIWHMSQTEPDPNATSIAAVSRVRALASGKQNGVAVCCDSGKSFRHELTPTYKATRPEHDAPRQHQIALAMETLVGDGFPVWAVKGFEADDLIASAAAWATKTGASALIVTADKDLLQLVGTGVRAMNLRDGTIVEAAGVFEKFGVRPGQMRDYLTLVGDTSDNVIGAKGIGPKRAADMLAKFGTLDALYAELESVGGATIGLTPAISLALREFKQSGAMELARSLITLRTDVQMPFDDIFKDRVPADAADFSAEEDDMHAEPVASAASKDVATVEGETQRPKPDAASSVPNGGDSGRSTALAVQGEVLPAQAEWTMQLEPRSMGEARRLAEDMFKSRLFSAYGTPAAVLSTVMAGRELGMQAMASLRAFHIVDGKPTLAADLIRALVIRSGAAKYFRCTERTNERATFETQRGDDPPIALTYTVAEAKEAGLVKPNSGWTKSPADQCVARSSSKLARLVYPDVTHGLYAPEEFD